MGDGSRDLLSAPWQRSPLVPSIVALCRVLHVQENCRDFPDKVSCYNYNIMGNRIGLGHLHDGVLELCVEHDCIVSKLIGQKF